MSKGHPTSTAFAPVIWYFGKQTAPMSGFASSTRRKPTRKSCVLMQHAKSPSETMPAILFTCLAILTLVAPNTISSTFPPSMDSTSKAK